MRAKRHGASLVRVPYHIGVGLFRVPHIAPAQEQAVVLPHQQRRIVEASIAVETCRLWLLRAARAVEAQDTKPDSATLSLLAREVTETCCRDVMRIVEQALGMGAHRAGSPVERIARDLRLFLCQAAPDAKRARAAQTLVQRGVRPEFL